MRQRIPYVTTALIAVNLIVFFLAEAVSGSTLRTDVLTLWGGASVSLPVFSPTQSAGASTSFRTETWFLSALPARFSA